MLNKKTISEIDIKYHWQRDNVSTIQDYERDTPDLWYIHHDERVALNQVLNRLFIYLNDNKSVKIMKMRHGLDDGVVHTLAFVGEHFGLSRQRVYQIEYAQLQKLLHPDMKLLLNLLNEPIALLLGSAGGLMREDDIAEKLSQELDYISVNGYKSIRSAKVGLRPINVLIGPNGSGKSNFIGLFAFLREIRDGRLNDYVRKAGGADQLLYFGSKVTEEIRIEISFMQEVNRYELALQPTKDDNLYPAQEVAYYWDKKHYPEHPYSYSLNSRENGLEAGMTCPQHLVHLLS